MSFTNVASKIQHLEAEITSLRDTIDRMYDFLKLEEKGLPRPVRPKPPPSTPAGFNIETITLPDGRTTTRMTLGNAAARRGLTPEPNPEPKVTAAELPKLETYKYTPLKPEKSEVRVLTLQPSQSSTDPVQCKLTPVSLDHVSSELAFGTVSQSQYQVMTLSYTWGDSSDTELIAVDGKSLRVTKNLHAAMKHFRALPSSQLTKYATDIRRPLYWWIDAVCIDQGNLDERSSQVQLMTRLYRQAFVGHVWLGHEADGSARAMDLVRKIGYQPTSEEDRNKWQYRRKPGQTHEHLGPGLLPRKLPDEPEALSDYEKELNYKVLIKLFNRPWFSRVWIRQEFALPETMKFHCGTETCTWEEMTKAARVLSYMVDELRLADLAHSELRTGDSSVTCFRRAEQLRKLRARVMELRKPTAPREQEPYLPMRFLLYHSRDSDSTDPRDKVFAMLPLANPEKTALVADYRRPYLEVYKSMVLEQATRSLNILSACQYDSDRKGLPSWIPDLSRPWKFMPTVMYLYIDGPYDYKEDFRFEDPEYELLSEKSALKVKGIVFDSIDLTNNATARVESSSSDLLALIRTWWEWHQSHRLSNDGDFRDTRPYDYKYYVGSQDEIWRLWKLDPRQQFYVKERGANNRDLDASVFTYSLKRDDPEVRTVEHFLPADPQASWEGQEGEQMGRLFDVFYGRKFVRTENGAFGLVPAAAQIGDRICQIKGAVATFVVREAPGDANQWLLIGDAYFIHGIKPLDLKPEPEIQDVVFV